MELANGAMAMVVGMAGEAVQLDANNMMAGKNLTFELEVGGADSAPPGRHLLGVGCGGVGMHGAWCVRAGWA